MQAQAQSRMISRTAPPIPTKKSFRSISLNGFAFSEETNEVVKVASLKLQTRRIQTDCESTDRLLPLESDHGGSTTSTTNKSQYDTVSTHPMALSATSVLSLVPSMLCSIHFDGYELWLLPNDRCQQVFETGLGY
jgi:hypothetical protein